MKAGNRDAGGDRKGQGQGTGGQRNETRIGDRLGTKQGWERQRGTECRRMNHQYAGEEGIREPNSVSPLKKTIEKTRLGLKKRKTWGGPQSGFGR